MKKAILGFIFFLGLAESSEAILCSDLFVFDQSHVFQGQLSDVGQDSVQKLAFLEALANSQGLDLFHAKDLVQLEKRSARLRWALAGFENGKLSAGEVEKILVRIYRIANHEPAFIRFVACVSKN